MCFVCEYALKRILLEQSYLSTEDLVFLKSIYSDSMYNWLTNFCGKKPFYHDSRFSFNRKNPQQRLAQIIPYLLHYVKSKI